MVQDVLHELKNIGFGVHFPAAFWEHVPACFGILLCPGVEAFPFVQGFHQGTPSQECPELV